MRYANFVALAASALLPVPPCSPAVVVEEVQPQGAVDRAGIRSGDRLETWSCGDRRQPLTSPFAVQLLELEQSPRCPVELCGKRGGEPFCALLPPGAWRLVVRPPGLGGVAERDTAGLESMARAAARDEDQELAAWLYLRVALLTPPPETVNRDEVPDLYRRALAAAQGLAPAEQSLLHMEVGRELIRQRRYDVAEQELQTALSLRRQLAERSLAVAESYHWLALLALQRGDLDSAEEYNDLSLQLRREQAPGSLVVAVSLNNLANLAWHRRDLDRAEQLHRQALAIRRELDPNSLAVAASLHNLGSVVAKRGDLETAEQRFRQALAIRERLAPDSSDLAASFLNLGAIVHHGGDLQAAEKLFNSALAILSKLEPGGRMVAKVYNNLGGVALDRGNLLLAEDLLQSALAIKQKLAPESLEVASTCGYLGLVAQQRGDLDEATALLRRSLAISERLAPDSLDSARSMNNLGKLEQKRGDLDAAEQLYRRALATIERLGPPSLDTALLYQGLAQVAEGRGRLDEAEELQLSSLAIRSRLASEGLPLTWSLADLSRIARGRGDLEAAEQYLRRSLVILARLAPGTSAEADALHALGGVLHAAGRREEARAALAAGVDAIEAQLVKLGGSEESRATVRGRRLDLYRDYLELLLELGRPEEAFQVLERSRARELQAMLAQRDLSFRADIPEELDRERRVLSIRCRRAREQLSQLSPVSDSDQVEQLLQDLRVIRDRARELRKQIRALAPRLAALHYPEPIDLATARRSLEPGTAVLSYCLGPERSHLFVLDSDGVLTVDTLPVGEADLQESVERYRRLIAQRRSDGYARRTLARRGLELSSLLLSPAAVRAVSDARQLLVVPDGPLHRLPFAALAMNSGEYLVEQLPLRIADSLSVHVTLGRLQNLPRQTPERRLIAFADPLYQASGTVQPDPVLRSFADHGPLSPLPASRIEVERIAGLFGDSAVTYLGAAATEEQVRAVPAATSLLHLAVHGLIDSQMPLDSALALSTPAGVGGDNGLLQAWEIFQDLRLDCDLVVLSACGSALGKEITGEGVLGLTRAFRYAGARAVMASLWEVSDDSTAELMIRFYRFLDQGQTTAQALHSAQLELLRGPLERPDDEPIDATHPFFWAAFQVYGS